MSVISPKTRILLSLSSIKGVGPAALKKVAASPFFWEQSLGEWGQVAPQISRSIGDRPVQVVWDEAVGWADHQIFEAERSGVRILSPVDHDYPQLLSATKDDPFLLFVKGILHSGQSGSVAIIGTREPTQHGLLIAHRLTQFFVEQNWSVVSGLALGCDAIAHQSALHFGGHTIAVLAHGLQTIAPSIHKKLAYEILEAGGALVSEYPFGVKATGSQFVKRDRTQAGLSRGVVMIQSGIQGGSLHASRAALDYRRWLAVPYPTDKDKESGEPKIQANLVIADGSATERADLLRCSLERLQFVRVVRGRDDYLRLIVEDSSMENLDQKDIAVRSGNELFFDEGVVIGEADKNEDVTLKPLDQSLVTQDDGEVVSEVVIGEADKNEEASLKPLGQSLATHDDGEVVNEEEPNSSVQENFSPSMEAVPFILLLNIDEVSKFRKFRIDTSFVEKSTEESEAENFSLSMVYARVRYLKGRLDELKRISKSKSLGRKERVYNGRFLIEDILVQMRRVFDDAIHVHAGDEEKDLMDIISHQRFSSQDQKVLQLSDLKVLQATNESFMNVLGFLTEDISSSIVVVDSEDLDVLPAGMGRLSLEDIVRSFNELSLKILARRG